MTVWTKQCKVWTKYYNNMNILTFEYEQNDSFNKGNSNKIWQFEQNKLFEQATLPPPPETTNGSGCPAGQCGGHPRLHGGCWPWTGALCSSLLVWTLVVCSSIYYLYVL